MIEILIAILVGAIVLAIATGVGVMALIALLRTRRVSDLARRVELLEARLKAQQTGPAPMAAAASEQAVADVTVAPLGRPEAGPAPSPTASARHRRPIQWELLIGQKAFGWVAVALAVFGTGYFLKYAYENRWVGPIGRVGFGVVGGVTLTIAGLWYYRRGGRILAQMLTACGIVVLYLATYSAFGFYDLLPSFHAGGFLTAVVLLSAIIAVCYDSPSIAMVAVLGGLVCPLLMHTEHDTYVALFCYLVSINLGVAAIALVRSWPFVSSVALYGTQGLFWSWYWGNYHPEKLGWSLAFQGLIFGLYVGQDLAVQLLRGTGARRETAFRILVNAACGFGAYYVLMRYDHRPWMGVSAVVMAAFYALLARGTLVIRRECTIAGAWNWKAATTARIGVACTRNPWFSSVAAIVCCETNPFGTRRAGTGFCDCACIATRRSTRSPS